MVYEVSKSFLLQRLYIFSWKSLNRVFRWFQLVCSHYLKIDFPLYFCIFLFQKIPWKYTTQPIYCPKVQFKRKAWGLMPKSHMILIEIKKETCYLKKNSQTPPQEKSAKIWTDEIYIAFGPITSSFSLERDFE